MLIRRDATLKELTNYRIGGPVEYFCEVGSIVDIKEALEFSKGNDAPFFIIGGGTNILANDSEFTGLIIKPVFRSVSLSESLIESGAGVNMAELLEFATDNGLSGLEWAGGLPGSLGGAIRGNAGAFGGEIKDVVRQVISFDTKRGVVIKRDNAECEFTYRSSIFKTSKNNEIIMQAVLFLNRGDKDQIRKSTEDKINFRRLRHPLEYPSAGSVFKNVDLRLAPEETVDKAKAVIKIDPFPVIPAAYLIGEAGLKGTRVGGAMISDKHSNFIVNVDEAKASDVRTLIRIVKKEVSSKFGVDLEEEIMLL